MTPTSRVGEVGALRRCVVVLQPFSGMSGVGAGEEGVYFYGAPAHFTSAGRGRGRGRGSGGGPWAWGGVAAPPPPAARGRGLARGPPATGPGGRAVTDVVAADQTAPVTAVGSAALGGAVVGSGDAPGVAAGPSPGAVGSAGSVHAAASTSTLNPAAAVVTGSWGNQGYHSPHGRSPAVVVPTVARSVAELSQAAPTGERDASATASGSGSGSGSGSAPSAPVPAVRRPPVSWAAAVGREAVKEGDTFRAEAPDYRASKVPEQRSATVIGAREALTRRQGPRPRPQDEDETIEVCVYFARGNCMYGSRCFYRHVQPKFDPTTVTEAASGPTEALVLDTWEITPEDEAELDAKELQVSREADCAICFENPLVRGEWFGVLTGCSHAFCLNCIREWRARTDLPTETVRSCPACRTVSHFIVPSARIFSHSSRKQAAIDSYKAKLNAIPCRNFAYGEGSCPFGSSCFYAHRLPDGTEADAPVPRLRVDEEGQTSTVDGVKLSDYLG